MKSPQKSLQKSLQKSPKSSLVFSLVQSCLPLAACIVAVMIAFSGASEAAVPTIHGMVVFGEGETTYASHLPMFHPPHDQQLILKITMTNDDSAQTLAAYANAKKTGKFLFTLRPEIMDLEPIIQGQRSSFKATLFDGHFERDGAELGPVTVEIEKIVLSKKLDANQAPQNKHHYLVFGAKGQYYAAHLIQGRPSFDAILEVSQPYQLQHSICRTRVCPDPEVVINPEQPETLSLTGPKSPEDFKRVGQPDVPSVTLGNVLLTWVADVRKVIYLEQGDLSH